MSTAIVEYLGDLRTKCTHVQSGTVIYTDAPVDNNGRGEAFSPTDLVVTAYASCMLTIIGVFCNANGYVFKSGKAEIVKVMASDPRRISEIYINMDLSGNDWDQKTQEKVIRAAKACPVAHSVHQDILITFDYKF